MSNKNKNFADYCIIADFKTILSQLKNQLNHEEIFFTIGFSLSFSEHCLFGQYICQMDKI
jgi:hypothetical protein